MITPENILRLKKPCENRGIELINNNNGTVSIAGYSFDSMKELEGLLITIPRIDYTDGTEDILDNEEPDFSNVDSNSLGADGCAMVYGIES